MLVVESAAGESEGAGNLGRRGLAFFAPGFDFGRVDFGRVDFGFVDFAFALVAVGRGDLVRFTDFLLASLRFVVLATLSLLITDASRALLAV
jgi:hypothetical protein